MKLWNAQTKQWEDVADPAQVQAQYLAGTHGFAPDAQVPVEDEYGEAKYVSPNDVDATLAKGGSITTPEKVDAAKLQKEYGGIKGAAIEAVEGGLRGATMDLSDPLAVEGARLVGGDELAEKTRQHLQRYKEANPTTALVSEIGGATLPALVSGGETAPETAAEVGTELAARGARPSIIGTIARYTPSAMVDRAGMAATRAAEEVLGSRAATSALGRIAKTAASHAIGDSVPGMIYGGAGQLDEDYLSGGNHALTAEKTIAALGHGALWGVLLGGGLAGSGAAAKEIAAPMLRAGSPFLEKAAGDQMWKALDPLKKYTQEAEAKAGGTSAVGNTLIEKLGFGNRPLSEAAMSPVELAPKIDEAVQAQGHDINAFLQQHGAQDVTINGQKIVDAMDSVIQPLRGKALHEGIVSSLEEAKRSIMEKLGLVVDDVEAHGMARDKALDMGLKPGTEKFQRAVDEEMADRLSEVLDKKQVKFSDLLEQRKAIDQMAYVEAKALNPKMRVEQLREMRRRLADIEVDAIDSHAKSIGLSDTAKQDYLKLKKDFQRLSIAQDAANQTTARMATNRNLSLSDYAAGVVPGMMALVHGNIPGAVLGMASSVAHRAIRRHGNALAAATLHKLSRLDLLARASQTVDRDLLRAAETLGGKSPYRRLSRFTGPESSASAKAKWKHAQDAYPQSATITPEHLERALPGLQMHAPETSKAIIRKMNEAALYAALNAPKPLNSPTLADPMPETRVTAQDAEGHYDRVHAVEDPVDVLASAAETGRLSAIEFQTIKANYPQLLEDFKAKILDTLAKPHPPLSSDQVRFLSTIFEGGGDELSDPAVASVIQKAYATPAAQPPAQQQMQKTKPIEGLADSSKTRLQSVRAQHGPGAGA